MAKYSVPIRSCGYREAHNIHIEVEAANPAQAMKKALTEYPAKVSKKEGANWGEEDWVTPLPESMDHIRDVALIVGLVVDNPVEVL